MAPQNPSCAILADRHTVLAVRIRDLLEAYFETVYVVCDAPSLRVGAQQLVPALIVLDLALAGSDCPRLLQEISQLSPGSRVIVLTVHDDATVARMALASGARGVVLKRSIGSDFLCAVSAVLRGEQYISSAFELNDSAA